MYDIRAYSSKVKKSKILYLDSLLAPIILGLVLVLVTKIWLVSGKV